MRTTPSNEELLEALCAIDSRTVDGAAGTTRVAEALAERLRPLGFEMEWVEAAPDEQPRGQHLKAVRNARADTRVVLMGHTDTVLGPDDLPFRRDAASGRCCGAGVCDMKGGCVILVEAVRFALEAHEAVRDAGLVVLLNCSEELSGPSFRELLRREAEGATACLNFEPAGVDDAGVQEIVVARKGVVRFELKCYGRAEHAGNAHDSGVNAIRELARKIEQIEALTDYARGVTTNVGFVRGGHVSNQVADEALARFELRAFEPAELDRAREAVRRICAEVTVRSAADGTPTRLELTQPGGYPPWAPNAATDELARRYVAFARERGVTVAPARRGGAADASHVADLAPTLDGLGIVGGGLHSLEEWADLASLNVRAKIAADLLAHICERAG